MEKIIAILLQVLLWLGALVLLAVVYREGFENLISQLLVEPVAARFKKAFGWLKQAQPVLVLLIACAFSVALKLDFVSTLNGVIKVIPTGELAPETLQIATGVIAAASAFFVHRVTPQDPLKRMLTP